MFYNFCFQPKYAYFIAKERLTFKTLKYMLFSLNPPHFSTYLFLRKMQTHFCREESSYTENSKKSAYTSLFPVLFHSSKLVYFIEN